MTTRGCWASRSSRSHGDDDHHGLMAGCAQQVVEQLQARGIAPLRVVDDQQHRLVSGRECRARRRRTSAGCRALQRIVLGSGRSGTGRRSPSSGTILANSDVSAASFRRNRTTISALRSHEATTPNPRSPSAGYERARATVTPRWAAHAASSSARRVLPIPASPVTSNGRGRPSSASRQHACACPSSATRPTKPDVSGSVCSGPSTLCSVPREVGVQLPCRRRRLDSELPREHSRALVVHPHGAGAVAGGGVDAHPQPIALLVERVEARNLAADAQGLVMLLALRQRIRQPPLQRHRRDRADVRAPRAPTRRSNPRADRRYRGLRPRVSAASSMSDPRSARSASSAALLSASTSIVHDGSERHRNELVLTSRHRSAAGTDVRTACSRLRRLVRACASPESGQNRYARRWRVHDSPAWTTRNPSSERARAEPIGATTPSRVIWSSPSARTWISGSAAVLPTPPRSRAPTLLSFSCVWEHEVTCVTSPL